MDLGRETNVAAFAEVLRNDPIVLVSVSLTREFRTFTEKNTELVFAFRKSFFTSRGIVATEHWKLHMVQ